MTMTTSTLETLNFASATTIAAANLLQSSGLAVPKRSGTQEKYDTDNGSVTSAGDETFSSCSDSSSEVCSALVCDSSLVRRRIYCLPCRRDDRQRVVLVRPMILAVSLHRHLPAKSDDNLNN